MSFHDDESHQEEGVLLNLDALLKSVMFSPPSVLPLLFSPSLAPWCHQAPPQVILPSAASVALLPFRWLLVIKPDPWAWCVPKVQSPLLCAHPFLFLPFHSYYTLVSTGLQVFEHSLAFVWSALPSPTHLVVLNAPSSGKNTLPSLSWTRPSCSGSKMIFSIFHSIISHNVILTSLLPGLPE